MDAVFRKRLDRRQGLQLLPASAQRDPVVPRLLENSYPLGPSPVRGQLRADPADLGFYSLQLVLDALVLAQVGFVLLDPAAKGFDLAQHLIHYRL
jgi:hypothetical protein